SNCPHPSSSASRPTSSWTTAPDPPCACNSSATRSPISKSSHAASGTRANAPDHSADEDPRRGLAGRFSSRHRWPGATVPAGPWRRPLRWRGLRVSQSQGDGAEGADVRWSGVLVVPQAPLARTLPLVALPGRRRRRAVVHLLRRLAVQFTAEVAQLLVEQLDDME